MFHKTVQQLYSADVCMVSFTRIDVFQDSGFESKEQGCGLRLSPKGPVT